MSWNIDIVATPTVDEVERILDGKKVKIRQERTALENAQRAVLVNKHEISETHHVGDDSAARHESWVKRAANDAFENLLTMLPDRFARIEMKASGGTHVDSFTFNAGKAV